jgi:hypothetical protein
VLYKKLFFQKLCLHFYIFHEKLISDTAFFTNFFQLSGGGALDKNTMQINYDDFCHYSLQDMFSYTDYNLFSIYCEIFQ